MNVAPRAGGRAPRDFYPPRDRSGKIVLHKMGLPTFLRATPSVLGFFKETLPDELWSTMVDDDDQFQVIVICPCGEEVMLGFGGLAECECHRFFMHTGKEVRVGREIVD